MADRVVDGWTISDAPAPKSKTVDGWTIEDAPDDSRPLVGAGSDNTFLNILDTLNTPQQAIMGAAKAGIDTVRGGPTAGGGYGLLNAIGKGAMEGMRANTSFGDVLSSAGWTGGEQVPVPGIGNLPLKEAAGFAGDVALDPLNLLPVGAISKGVKAASKATGLTAKLAPLIPKEPALITATKKLLGGIEQEYAYGQVAAKRSGREVHTAMKGIAKEQGVPLSEVARRVSRQRERPFQKISEALKADGINDVDAALNIAADIDNVNEALSSAGHLGVELDPIVDLAAKIGRNFDENLTKEIALGLRTVELDDAAVNYLTHMPTAETKKLLIEHGDAEMKRFGNRYIPAHASQIGRKWRGVGVDEINELGRAKQLPGYEGVYFEKFFEDNPALLQTTRLLAGEKAMAAAKVFNGVTDPANGLGMRLSTNPELRKIVAEDPTRYAKLSIANNADPRVAPFSKLANDTVFEPEVAAHIDAFYNATLAPKQPQMGLMQSSAAYLANPSIANAGPVGNSLLAVFDEAQKAWKQSTLFIFPAYHTRNAVGNWWNNGLAGIWDPSEYARASSYQRLADDKIFNVGGKQWVKGDMDAALDALGIKNQFAKYMNIKDDLSVEVAGRSSRNPIEIGKRVGSLIEDNARMAHFFNRLDKGMSMEEAALSVNKYLFDYDDIGPIGKSVLRRVFPFYQWTRKNVPLQLRSLIDKPQQFDALGDVINHIQASAPAPGDSDHLVADWMKENTAVRVRSNLEGNPEYMLLGGWIPAADLNKITSLGGVADTIAQNLTPFIKAPIEFMTNKATFFGRDVESFPGEKEKFMGVAMRKRTSQVLKNLRVLVEVDRYMATVGAGNREVAGAIAGGVAGGMMGGGTGAAAGAIGGAAIGSSIKSYFGNDPMKLTTRNGESPGVYFWRTLFGARTYTIDLPAERRQRANEQRELLRKKLRESRLGHDYNIPVIDDLMQEP